MKILLGVTGSVAATLTPKMVKALQDVGYEVSVVSTERGLYFFDPKDVNAKVWKDMDEWSENGYTKKDPVPHIDFGKWSDLLLIAPLSADTLSDISNGKCNKFLTCIARAWPKNKPIVIAPAMNTNMWEHPITNEQIVRISRWFKLSVVGPIEKRLACGDVGKGAMSDIKDIISAVDAVLKTP